MGCGRQVARKLYPLRSAVKVYIHPFYSQLVELSFKHTEVKLDTVSQQDIKVSVTRQGLKRCGTLLNHTMTFFGTKNSWVPDKLKVSSTPKDPFQLGH